MQQNFVNHSLLDAIEKIIQYHEEYLNKKEQDADEILKNIEEMKN